MRAQSCLAAVSLWAVLSVGTAGAQAPAVAPASVETPASAKTWLDNRAAIEAYLRDTEIVSIEELKVGVTRPRRAKFPDGGLVQYMAFKNVPPGRQSGYWESYKSELAAYAMDQLLGLDMVPPTVEKRVKGDLGAAVMWCAPVKSFAELKGVPTPPSRYVAMWFRQLAKAKMFDNLIGNKDPNLGNWLVDPAWNLILIDHTRAFTPDKDLYHKLDHVDVPLWDKMKALTVEQLTPVLSPYMGKGEIKAVIDRRDKMADAIAKLVKERGEGEVMMK
jgi:hypothetical protein